MTLPQHDGRFHTPGHVELQHLAPEIPLPFEDAENKSGGTINAGQVVASDASGVGFVLGDNTAFGTRAVGLATETIGPAISITVQTGGVLELADWTAATGAVSLPARSQWFLGTGGLLTQTPSAASGTQIQFVGEAIAPQKMRIAITQPMERS